MKNFILDVNEVPKELKLIFSILKNENNNDILFDLNEYQNEINWKYFLDLSIHHRVYPLLASKLKNFPDGFIPHSVIQTVRQYYKKNIFKMLQLSGEMNQLAEEFKINGIKSIFLKGPMLGNEIYGDISLRTCGDLDLLISIEDLDSMHQLLELQGYVKDDYILSVLGDWKWRHHHITYYHKFKKIKIEIHWRLNPGPGKEPDFQTLWQRKRNSILSKMPIYILGKEDLFLFLVSHGARHGWSRLRWLVDIYQMIEQGIDWKQIQILSKEHNNFHIVGQSIILCSQLLNTGLIKEMRKFYSSNQSKFLAQDAVYYLEKMVNLHNEQLPKEVSRYHARHLYSLMSSKQKVLFILSYLYPYHVDTVTLPLPQKYHFLYFLLRPFLCFWRKARKQAIS